MTEAIADSGDYETELDRGRAALAARDLRAAYRHFGRAHNIGHSVLVHHLAAHRGLLATAWAGRRPDRVLTQCFLLTGGALMDRSEPGTRPSRFLTYIRQANELFHAPEHQRA